LRVNANPKPQNLKSNSPTNKAEGISLLFAFIFGMVIISSSIFIANYYTVSAIVLVVALFFTVLWRNSQQSWILLASVLAANPVNSLAPIAGNLIFALVLLAFNVHYLSRLPKWIYPPTILALLSFLGSSINWISDDLASNTLPQLAYMLTYLLGPLFLLPLIYFRMSRYGTSLSNLKGLLFYLVLPSTLLLLVAYWLGSPIKNEYKDFFLVMNVRLYKFGNTVFNFTRTHVGFILSSMTCASTAIIIVRVKMLYRLLAGTCLVVNALLLLITGSVGSAIACLCGIIVIYFSASRRIHVIGSLISIVVIAGLLFMVWLTAPTKVKNYVEERYQERFVSKGKGIDVKDRVILWRRAINYLIEHPAGVGWSILVGDRIKSNPHNDYLLYAIAYGLISGMVYIYIILRLLIYFFRKSKTFLEDSSGLAVNLAGLGVAVVVFINSMADHMVANRWYFGVIWSVIWYSYFCSQTKAQPLATATRQKK
jgi:hypothetical protein